MKKIILFTLTILFLTSTAYSVTFTQLADDGYVETQNDFFSLTDFTTANSSFSIAFEQASYESTFGLYTVSDMLAPAFPVQTLQVFSFTDEPSFTPKSVNFQRTTAGWEATTDGVNYTPFDTTFGFYFGVDNNDDNVADYTFYTAENLNTKDQDVEHIRTFFRDYDNTLYILLDDQLGAYPDVPDDGRDNDWTDMQIFATDVAPVPEPATLLLLGSGLVGLAFLKRRK